MRPSLYLQETSTSEILHEVKYEVTELTLLVCEAGKEKKKKWFKVQSQILCNTTHQNGCEK